MSAPAILQTCSACAHEFRVLATLAGRQVACPHCRRPLLIVAQPLQEDRLVGKEVGGCRLIRRLGAGAIGVVYEAEQISVGRSVAIKLLSQRAASDPRILSRFQREAKLSAQLQHPHIVTVFDCGFERGVHYLIMEYVDGSTLAALISERGRLPWREAARLSLEIALGLEHAHAIGIVHRDIKPANILLTAEGHAKIADLGLAKQIDDERPTAALQHVTVQGVALGSPAYMPPEQIRSARDVTPASDIYALGVTAFQMLSGQLPFEGVSAPEVMTKVLRDPPPRLASLVADAPAGLGLLIDRCLAKEPDARPADAASFIGALQTAVAGAAEGSSALRRAGQRPPSAARTAVAARPDSGRRGRLLDLVLFICLIIVIATTLGLLYMRWAT